MKGVVVVEDDDHYARSLTALLEEAPEFEFLGHWFSAEACLEGLSELAREPDIFVVDMGLPGADGAQLIAQLKERQPMASCVAHTVFEDKTHVFAALRAGADGYLLKGTAPRKLLDGLRSLDCGGAPLTPKVARFLVAEFQQPASNPLTSREQDVLDALAQGFSYQQCAENLIVSVHTIHTHVKKIYEKMAVGGRTEAVEKARNRGWLRL